MSCAKPLPAAIASVVMLALVPISGPAQEAAVRRWTTTSGATADASFVELRGSTVVLRRSNGQMLQIQRGALSDPDLKYLEKTKPTAATAKPGGPATTGDWPGWLGPNRDGKSLDTGLLQEWPPGGPRELWKASDLGEGFSSPAVAGGRVYVTGTVDGKFTVFARDVDGKPQWAKVVGPDWSASYPGARCSPALDGERLYVLTGMGLIACLETATGKEVWKRNMSEFGGRPHQWGFAESVLVTDGLAVVAPGGNKGIVALDAATGKSRWESRGNGGPAHYGSCIRVSEGGTDMIVSGNGAGLVGVSSKEGHVLWSNDFSAGNVANCPTPASAGGYIFWANGYGKGGVCLQLKGTQAREVWQTRNMDCHHGGYVIHDGHIYGNHNDGWSCLDLQKGQQKWFNRGVGKGSLCYADGMLYLFSESGGHAALVRASPEKFEMKGDFHVRGEGMSWAHPVVAGGRLYLRFGSALYCLDVRAK
jgi:hypothetical protein